MIRKFLPILSKLSALFGVGFLILLGTFILGIPSVFAGGPQVTEVYPVDGGENVPLNISARITFNVDMDKNSFDEGALLFTGPNFSSVPFTKSWDGNRTVVMTPTQGLQANTNYGLIVRGSELHGAVVGVQDTNGNELQGHFVSSFTTGENIAAPTALNLTYSVDLNREQALNLIQQRFIQFQPSGYADNINIPPEHVVMPLKDFLTILNNLPPNFDLNSIKPITSGGETSIPTASENFTSGTSMWLGEGIYQGDFNVQGRTFNMPIYVAPNPLLNQ